VQIVARLYLLRTDEGGRKTPFGGPRASFDFGGRDNDGTHMFNICSIDYGTHSEINLGEEITITLEPISPDLVRPFIEVGNTFSMWEAKITGQGTVLDIIEEDSE
jgi:hypothetical protein